MRQFGRSHQLPATQGSASWAWHSRRAAVGRAITARAHEVEAPHEFGDVIQGLERHLALVVQQSQLEAVALGGQGHAAVGDGLGLEAGCPNVEDRSLLEGVAFEERLVAPAREG